MYFEEFMCFFKNDIRPFKSEASKICKKKSFIEKITLIYKDKNQNIRKR